MESTYLFKVYYRKELVCTIEAHTKWEAVDKVYFKYLHLNLSRTNLRAKK